MKKGKAFVCDLSAEQIREYRGDFNTPGKESPYRNRSIEENLRLFEEMKEGKYQDGEKVLRAKIDMASPNINMRDPVIYRVAHMHHHNTCLLYTAGEIMTGMKDQMKEIAVVIFDYGTSTDHGSEIFHIFTEKYVNP